MAREGRRLRGSLPWSRNRGFGRALVAAVRGSSGRHEAAAEALAYGWEASAPRCEGGQLPDRIPLPGRLRPGAVCGRIGSCSRLLTATPIRWSSLGSRVPSPGCRSVSASRWCSSMASVGSCAQGRGGDGHGGNHGAESRRAGVGAAAGPRWRFDDVLTSRRDGHSRALAARWRDPHRPRWPSSAAGRGGQRPRPVRPRRRWPVLRRRPAVGGRPDHPQAFSSTRPLDTTPPERSEPPLVPLPAPTRADDSSAPTDHRRARASRSAPPRTGSRRGFHSVDLLGPSITSAMSSSTPTDRVLIHHDSRRASDLPKRHLSALGLELAYAWRARCAGTPLARCPMARFGAGATAGSSRPASCGNH